MSNFSLVPRYSSVRDSYPYLDHFTVRALDVTGYFNAIPRELDQAAAIDGCSRLAILFRILIHRSTWPRRGRILRFRGVMGRFLFVRSLEQFDSDVTTRLTKLSPELAGEMGLDHCRHGHRHRADHFVFCRCTTPPRSGTHCRSS